MLTQCPLSGTRRKRYVKIKMNLTQCWTSYYHLDVDSRTDFGRIRTSKIHNLLCFPVPPPQEPTVIHLSTMTAKTRVAWAVLCKGSSPWQIIFRNVRSRSSACWSWGPCRFLRLKSREWRQVTDLWRSKERPASVGADVFDWNFGGHWWPEKDGVVAGIVSRRTIG